MNLSPYFYHEEKPWSTSYHDQANNSDKLEGHQTPQFYQNHYSTSDFDASANQKHRKDDFCVHYVVQDPEYLELSVFICCVEAFLGFSESEINFTTNF